MYILYQRSGNFGDIPHVAALVVVLIKSNRKIINVSSIKKSCEEQYKNIYNT